MQQAFIIVAIRKSCNNQKLVFYIISFFLFYSKICREKFEYDKTHLFESYISNISSNCDNCVINTSITNIIERIQVDWSLIGGSET